SAAQAEAGLAVDLDEVVHEADQAEAGHQAQHEQAGRGDLVTGQQVPDHVADQRREHDHRAAHGRSTALGRVRGRSFLAYQLAVSAPGEQLDRQRRAEQGKDQGHPSRDDDGPHGATSPAVSARGDDPPEPPAASARATVCRPAARDALIRTTSPGWRRSPSTASAAGPSGTAISSPEYPATALAPVSIGAASAPTAMRPVTPVRAATMPACS